MDPFIYAAIPESIMGLMTELSYFETLHSLIDNVKTTALSEDVPSAESLGKVQTLVKSLIPLFEITVSVSIVLVWVKPRV